MQLILNLGAGANLKALLLIEVKPIPLISFGGIGLFIRKGLNKCMTFVQAPGRSRLSLYGKILHYEAE